jgi:hypothetical protein
MTVEFILRARAGSELPNVDGGHESTLPAKFMEDTVDSRALKELPTFINRPMAKACDICSCESIAEIFAYIYRCLICSNRVPIATQAVCKQWWHLPENFVVDVTELVYLRISRCLAMRREMTYCHEHINGILSMPCFY